MIEDLLMTAKFVSDLLAKSRRRKKATTIIRRTLRVEVATNLNLLTALLNRAENGLSVDENRARALLDSLSINAIHAGLIADPAYLEQESGSRLTQEYPDPGKTLSANIEKIAIKVSEMRALSSYRDAAIAETIDWKKRFENLKSLHLEAINQLRQ